MLHYCGKIPSVELPLNRSSGRKVTQKRSQVMITRGHASRVRQACRANQSWMALDTFSGGSRRL